MTWGSQNSTLSKWSSSTAKLREPDGNWSSSFSRKHRGKAAKVINLINRGQHPKPVEDEFQHAISRIKTLFGPLLDEDGNLIIADPNLAVFAVGDIKSTVRPADQLQSGWLLCD